MLRWPLWSVIRLILTVMIGIGAGPWLFYGIGLAKVDGRPLHASQTVVTPEDAESLVATIKDTATPPTRSCVTILLRAGVGFWRPKDCWTECPYRMDDREFLQYRALDRSSRLASVGRSADSLAYAQLDTK
jgi:hypothetical protein